jgi:gamma-glutamyl-gamma-aminobutyrate hydrolase PuuD
MLKKFKFHSNLKKIKGTLHEYLSTFITICPLILFGTRNVSDKSYGENQNKNRLQNVYENRAAFEIMWKTLIQPDRPHMTIQYGACAMLVG